MNTEPSASVPLPKRRWFTPRFSLRTLLVLVTIFAVMLGITVRWVRIAREYEALAREHYLAAQRAAGTAWGFQRFDRDEQGNVSSEADAAAQEYWRLHAFHLEATERFQRAAWFPLLGKPDIGTPPIPEL